MEDRKTMLPLLGLSKEETRVDVTLGHPSGYAKLCKYAPSQMKGLITPFTEGPPTRFLPYAPSHQEIVRLKEFEKLFPVIPEEARDTHNARRHAEALWQQLGHLGNAGFDPGLFRVDKYGNVLHWHAGPASPLAWEVDHWFPHSRGGRTVTTNLRIIQWQVNQRKKERLEFLIPWWDLQLGVSVNQFLYVFRSKNIEFRNKYLSLFFAGDEQLFASGHSWPQQFYEQKSQNGLAAAALSAMHVLDNESKPFFTIDEPELPGHKIAATPARRRWSLEEEEALRRAVKKFGPGNWKEIKESEVALARRSTVQIKDKYRLMKTDYGFGKENFVNMDGSEVALKRALQLKSLQEEEKREKDAELGRLEEHLTLVRLENEKQAEFLKDMDHILREHRQQLEKQREWAETQASYKLCLERMIRDTIHQSAIYMEQAKLNQAACNALAAQLETQIIVCESAESKLVETFREREELEAMAHSRSKGVDLVDQSNFLSKSFQLHKDTEVPYKLIKVLRIKGDQSNLLRSSHDLNRLKLARAGKGTQLSYDEQSTVSQIRCPLTNIRNLEDGINATNSEMRVRNEVGIDIQASRHRKLWRQISSDQNCLWGYSGQKACEVHLTEMDKDLEDTDELDLPASQDKKIWKGLYLEEKSLSDTEEQLGSELSDSKIQKRQDHTSLEEERNDNLEGRKHVEQIENVFSDGLQEEEEVDCDPQEKLQTEQIIITSNNTLHEEIENECVSQLKKNEEVDPRPLDETETEQIIMNNVGTLCVQRESNEFGDLKSIEKNLPTIEGAIATQGEGRQMDANQGMQPNLLVEDPESNTRTGKADTLFVTTPCLEEAFQNVLVLDESSWSKEEQPLESVERKENIEQLNADNWLQTVSSEKIAIHSQKSKAENEDLCGCSSSDKQKNGGEAEAKAENDKSKGIFEVFLRRLNVKRSGTRDSETDLDDQHLQHELMLRNNQDDGNDQVDPPIDDGLKDSAMNLTFTSHSGASPSLAIEEASQSASVGLNHHIRSMSTSMLDSRLNEDDTTLSRSGSKSSYLDDTSTREQQAKPGIRASLRAYTQAWIRTVKKLEARIQESN